MTEPEVVHELLSSARAGTPLLRLTQGQAIAQGLRMRREDGMSYPAIAKVLRRYHGIRWSENEVRRRLRDRGAEPFPRGVPYGPGHPRYPYRKVAT